MNGKLECSMSEYCDELYEGCSGKVEMYQVIDERYGGTNWGHLPYCESGVAHERSIGFSVEAL